MIKDISCSKPHNMTQCESPFVMRHKRVKLNTPVINTYSNQILHCTKLYRKLLSNHTILSLPPTPLSRQHQNGISYLQGHRSAPPWCGRHVDQQKLPECLRGGRDSVTTATTFTASRPSTQRQTDRLNPIKLCDYLESRGYGTPVIVTSSHVKKDERTLPPGVRARPLSKNPSIREKVRGRARLDYEMATIRADAFCEQERDRNFRTASANLRNRDVRFQEEEAREQVLREQADDTDDVISIVASPLDREELFSRIEEWMMDVDHALGRT